MDFITIPNNTLRLKQQNQASKALFNKAVKGREFPEIAQQRESKHSFAHLSAILNGEKTLKDLTEQTMQELVKEEAPDDELVEQMLKTVRSQVENKQTNQSTIASLCHNDEQVRNSLDQTYAGSTKWQEMLSHKEERRSKLNQSSRLGDGTSPLLQS